MERRKEGISTQYIGGTFGENNNNNVGKIQKYRTTIILVGRKGNILCHFASFNLSVKSIQPNTLFFVGVVIVAAVRSSVGFDFSLPEFGSLNDAPSIFAVVTPPG